MPREGGGVVMTEEQTGPESVNGGGYAEVSRAYSGYVADCRRSVVEDVDVMDTHRWLGGRLIQ